MNQCKPIEANFSSLKSMVFEILASISPNKPIFAVIAPSLQILVVPFNNEASNLVLNLRHRQFFCHFG